MHAIQAFAYVSRMGGQSRWRDEVRVVTFCIPQALVRPSSTDFSSFSNRRSTLHAKSIPNAAIECAPSFVRSFVRSFICLRASKRK